MEPYQPKPLEYFYGENPTGATLNPALREFWCNRNRINTLIGGRGSSKSWDAAGMAIYLAQSGTKKFLCTRQLQNKIENSVYSLLKVQIERFGLRDVFRVLDNKIICTATGSEFEFYGLWRHIDEIKSFEGADIHWSEEAHNLKPEQWKDLTPTIRRQGSEHWIIFNPRFATDFSYKKFYINQSKSINKRLINFDENPFLSETLRDEIESDRQSDPEEFAHVYLGIPRESDTSSFIRYSWVMAAVGAHELLGIDVSSASHQIGFDVADDGEDKCATALMHGLVLESIDEWRAAPDKMFESCQKVYSQAIQNDALVIYDSIGVGAGCGSDFDVIGQNGKKIRHGKFNAGAGVANPESRYGMAKVTNQEYFSGAKSQAWQSLADRFKNTYMAVNGAKHIKPEEMIFIRKGMPAVEKLAEELSSPKKIVDAAGRVQVEPKRLLKERGIPSHNLADALVMAALPRELQQQRRSFFSR
ncbi:MAG: PBSX family phage terminase large subunit [Betaproteobacteria bacterium]